MKKSKNLTRSMAIAALVLSGMAVSQARANTIITTFLFNSPVGNVNSSTKTYTSGGLSLTASAFDCHNASGGLCANQLTTNYSSHPTNLYQNSDGLGVADNLISSTNKYEIPNNQFIQLDFTSILTSETVTSIKFTMTDIVTAWSLYQTKVAGELDSTGGAALVNNAGPGTTTFTINNPTSDLISVIAGTNCDVVLSSIQITYSSSTTQATPEPATMLITGLALLGLGTILKKSRKRV